MNNTTELDRLQAAWAALDQRLDRLDLRLADATRGQHLHDLKRTLRPLGWGQTLQIVAGLLVIAVAVPVWQRYSGVPHVLAAALIMHAYGVAMIILGGLTLGRMAAVDFAAPVTDLDRSVLAIETTYVRGSTALGLAWWLLWIPFATVVFAHLGADFAANVGVALWWWVGAGVLGLVGTWGFEHWARRRPGLYARLRRNMRGASLEAARRELARIESLERDSPSRQ